MTPKAAPALAPMSEVTETAIAALCREIGPVNTARFINHFSTGLGDYTAERALAIENQTVDSIVQEIERRRSKNI
jgi:hypothetical protein